jgi:hypothetical protein
VVLPSREPLETRARFGRSPSVPDPRHSSGQAPGVMQGGFAQILKPGAQKPAGIALNLGPAQLAQRSSVSGQAAKPQSARQSALLMSQPQVSAATGSVLQNLNSLLTDSAQSLR